MSRVYTLLGFFVNIKILVFLLSGLYLFLLYDNKGDDALALAGRLPALGAFKGDVGA